MTARPWRGTLIFTGTFATLGVAALTKFVGVAEPITAATVGVAQSTTQSAAGSSSASSDSTGSSSSGSGSSKSAGSSDASKPSKSSSPTSTASPSKSSKVTVVGDTIQTRYGPVQVSLTFSGNTITGVQTLQSPNSHGESIQINAQATPILEQEVLTAQSAKIDNVSGASYTSAAYAESVQAAIDSRG